MSGTRDSIGKTLKSLTLKAQVIQNELDRFDRLDKGGVDTSAKREAFSSVFNLGDVRNEISQAIRSYYSDPDEKGTGQHRVSFKMKVKEFLGNENVDPVAFMAFCRIEAFKVGTGTGDNFSLGRTLQETILDGGTDSDLADITLTVGLKSILSAK